MLFCFKHECLYLFVCDKILTCLNIIIKLYLRILGICFNGVAYSSRHRGISMDFDEVSQSELIFSNIMSQFIVVIVLISIAMYVAINPVYACVAYILE